jgi:hypothetical protein
MLIEVEELYLQAKILYVFFGTKIFELTLFFCGTKLVFHFASPAYCL